MTTMTTAEVAADFKTTPKNLRKFLRDDRRGNDLPIAGKGARWSIEAREVRSMRTRYSKWQKAQDETRLARLAAKVEAQAEVENNDSVEATD